MSYVSQLFWKSDFKWTRTSFLAYLYYFSLEQNAHAESLQKFKARASHVIAQCKKLTPEELDAYKTQSYDAYDPYWWGELDEEKKVTEAPKKGGETEVIFHFDFREHGPSGNFFLYWNTLYGIAYTVCPNILSNH